MNFNLKSNYNPSGDQPEAISNLVEGIKDKVKYQSLEGVTGSGKTFTVANVIKEIKFPDHYQYTSKDINKIKQYAKELNAKILTTEKDYVKINDSDLDKIDFLGIDVVIKQEEELIKLIKSNL